MGWDLKVTRTNRRLPDTLEANLVGGGGGVRHRAGKGSPAFASFIWEGLLSWNGPRKASKLNKDAER